jgi:hypothetical protein
LNVLGLEEAETEGYVHDTELVVPNCPFCGLPHFHGNPKPGYKIGDVTGRYSHCDGIGGHYYIRIVGELSSKEVSKLRRRRERERRKRW